MECLVCGFINGNTCKSCQLFFHEVSFRGASALKCLGNGSCLIARDGRTCCKLCRYNKCLEVSSKLNNNTDKNENSNPLSANGFRATKRPDINRAEFNSAPKPKKAHIEPKVDRGDPAVAMIEATLSRFSKSNQEFIGTVDKIRQTLHID